MPDGSRLIDADVPPQPSGVVLVLHGGAARRRAMRVSPAQLSVLRMIPVATRVAEAAHGQLAVLRLLNTHRGWDTAHTPVQDVGWALAEVARRFGGDTAVGLVGHSLGGRAALLTADRPQVRGVVALAPWVYEDDAVADVIDTPIVIIHGDADRVASPDRSRRVADRLRRQTPVSYITVERGSHAMLGRRERFDGLAAHCITWMLLGEIADPVVARIAAGERALTV